MPGFGELAAATPGLSGADLRNLVNEAALLAARREQNEVRHKDFLDALEKIVLGPERPILLSRADKERIAYHEGGHTILGLVVPGADPVNRVSIVPRGQALGVTYQRPDSDRYNYPEAYLRARIVGMLGGRAAEEIVYGTRTTGAENDIEQATALARRMVTRWGMSERVGMVQLAPRENPYLGGAGGYAGARPFSEATAEAIDAEVLKIIGESHEEAKRLLSAHRKELDALAEALLSRETLNEQEVLAGHGAPAGPGPGDRDLTGSRGKPRRGRPGLFDPRPSRCPRVSALTHRSSGGRGGLVERVERRLAAAPDRPDVCGRWPIDPPASITIRRTRRGRVRSPSAIISPCPSP